MATTDANDPSAGSALDAPIVIDSNDQPDQPDTHFPLVDTLLFKKETGSEAAAPGGGVLEPAPSPRPADQPPVAGSLPTDDDTVAAESCGAASSSGSQSPAFVAPDAPLSGLPPLSELHSAELAVRDSEESASVAPSPALAGSELLAGVPCADRQPTEKKRKAKGDEEDTASARGQPSRKRSALAQPNEQGEWLVKKIMDHRVRNGECQLLVRWVETWEPLDALEETAALEEYLAEHGQLGGAAGQ